MAKRKVSLHEMLSIINGDSLPEEPSAIERLADLSYADSQALAKALYLRQLELQRTLRNMAQHYHDAHCTTTMREFADCYRSVCTANRKILAEEIVPSVGELPGD